MQSNLISLAYDGHTITYRDDGWFNATEAAGKWGKRPVDWLKLPSTKEYLAALQRHNPEVKKFHFGSKGGNAKGGATWLHPKLAVAFARWLDVDFAVWCDSQIDGIVRSQSNWSRLRHVSAASAKFLTAAIKDSRESCGKAIKRHHFSNEHCLVNFLLTGEFKGVNRDAMQGWQLDFIGHFDMRDGYMILKGMSYEERKAALAVEAARWREDNATKIAQANETMKLAA